MVRFETVVAFQARDFTRVMQHRLAGLPLRALAGIRRGVKPQHTAGVAISHRRQPGPAATRKVGGIRWSGIPRWTVPRIRPVGAARTWRRRIRPDDDHRGVIRITVAVVGIAIAVIGIAVSITVAAIAPHAAVAAVVTVVVVDRRLAVVIIAMTAAIVVRGRAGAKQRGGERGK